MAGPSDRAPGGAGDAGSAAEESVADAVATRSSAPVTGPGSAADPATSGLPTPTLPPIGRLSRLIQHNAAAMTRVGLASEATAQPLIQGVFDEDLLRPPVELARLGPAPDDAMTRIKTGRTRDFERPDAIVDQLERITPQFFLRNTARVERYADPNWIETSTVTVRDFGHWDDVRDAARCATERPGFDPETSSVRLAMLLAEREVVMVETRWNEVFGRPDPVE